MAMEINDAINLAGTGGLVAAAVYAARWLAHELRQSQRQTVELLTGALRENQRVLDETRLVLDRVGELLEQIRYDGTKTHNLHGDGMPLDRPDRPDRLQDSH